MIIIVTLEKSMSAKQRQKVLSDLYNSMQEKKRYILKKIRGSVIFDKMGKKSALDIQKEMRDEWN